MAKLTSIRSRSEEEYEKLQNYSVGTLHRASTSPETEASAGEEQPTEQQEQQEQPENSQPE